MGDRTTPKHYDPYYSDDGGRLISDIEKGAIEAMEMKPNISFLKKVRDREVSLSFGYTAKKGGHWTFRGGEKTAEKHAKAGFIRMPGAASLGRPAYALLTERGQAALDAAA
jgi:hypothetical protein